MTVVIVCRIHKKEKDTKKIDIESRASAFQLYIVVGDSIVSSRVHIFHTDPADSNDPTPKTTIQLTCPWRRKQSVYGVFSFKLVKDRLLCDGLSVSGTRAFLVWIAAAVVVVVVGVMAVVAFRHAVHVRRPATDDAAREAGVCMTTKAALMVLARSRLSQGKTRLCVERSRPR